MVPEFGFRAAHDLYLTGIRLAAVQSFDGQDFRDITNLLARAQPAPVWGRALSIPQGKSADQQPAIYLGFNLTLLRRQPFTKKGCGSGLGADPLVRARRLRSGRPELRRSPTRLTPWTMWSRRHP